MSTLHMIGHSHIDPVWFWRYPEGLQEIKSTFRSALDRMDEFEDFKYSASSVSFLKWIKQLDEQLYERIKVKIVEGRWELGGGWYNEPDCHLPTGEFFIRQGLYGQRFLCKEMGMITDIASNVDSFGHGPYIPMFLRHCKMKNYVFMRPRLQDENPNFTWKSPDGSKVKAISLPTEYTTWFDKTIKESIDICIEKLQYLDNLPCYYGVGNHGGGPTIQNIKFVKSVAKEKKDEIDIVFSNLASYFETVESKELEEKSQMFEGVNTGCYSIDLRFKQAYRKAEETFLLAERTHTLAFSITDKVRVKPEQWQEQAEIILFNEFHDILGGTYTLSAREDAINQLKSVISIAQSWLNLSIQDIANSIDTTGEGFPLILFNPNDKPFKGVVSTELNFFCLSPLKLTDIKGKEIVYQRVKTDCTMMNYNLGGRRRVCFQTQIPAMGITLVRAHEIKANDKSITQFPAETELDETNLSLENSKIRAHVDSKTGTLSYISESGGKNILCEPMRWEVWKDKRDSWGHEKGDDYSNTGENYLVKEISCVERGPLRTVIRAYLEHDKSTLRVLYTLNEEENHIKMDCYLIWNKPWHQLQLSSKINGDKVGTIAEIAGGIWQRDSESAENENKHETTKVMHRFVDVFAKNNGQGILMANDGLYGFTNIDNKLNLTILRSAIYAQGNAVNWHHNEDTYDYTDLGEHRFTILIEPHNKKILETQMYSLAEHFSNPYLYLLDCSHPGKLKLDKELSILNVQSPSVKVIALKQPENAKGIIIRLKEICGKTIQTRINYREYNWMVTVKNNSIATFRIIDDRIEELNGLEWLENRECVYNEEDNDDRQ